MAWNDKLAKIIKLKQSIESEAKSGLISVGCYRKIIRALNKELDYNKEDYIYTPEFKL